MMGRGLQNEARQRAFFFVCRASRLCGVTDEPRLSTEPWAC